MAKAKEKSPETVAKYYHVPVQRRMNGGRKCYNFYKATYAGVLEFEVRRAANHDEIFYPGDWVSNYGPVSGYVDKDVSPIREEAEKMVKALIQKGINSAHGKLERMTDLEKSYDESVPLTKAGYGKPGE